MKKRFFSWIVAQLFLSILITSMAIANENDVVKGVALCGDNTLITMQNAGMVAVMKADVGEDIFQQVTSMALELLESGEQTGYFDPGTPTTACGHENVMTITILGEK